MSAGKLFEAYRQNLSSQETYLHRYISYLSDTTDTHTRVHVNMSSLFQWSLRSKTPAFPADVYFLAQIFVSCESSHPVKKHNWE